MNLNIKANRTRVHAMRIALTLAQFSPDLLGGTVKTNNLKFRTRDLIVADCTSWPFIDLDPLLGNIEEILIDDGARASWPIDFGMCLPISNTNLDFRAVYARTISVKDARKLGAIIFSPKMARFEMIDFVNGRYDWGAEIRANLLGKWVKATPKPPQGIKDASGSSISLIGDMMAGAALRHRYEWSAIFDFPSGVSLRFGTNAQGVLEIFRDREKSYGELRRKSLLHWVRKHWRSGRSSGDAVHEVRKHMRGVEKLTWNGMDVMLVPAEYELEQI